jgi:hypothetical protein
MRSLLVVMAVGLLIAAQGCGKKSSDEIKQQADNKINAKGNAAIQNASYATDCSSDDYNFGTVKFPGAKTDYDLSDFSFTKKYIRYSDDCKTAAFIVQEKGTIKKVAESGLIANALEEDFNFEHTTVTIANSTVVAGFNLVHACGFNDWALNVEKDVSAQATQFLCPGSKSPRTAKELVLVENSNMYMGANTKQDDSQGRPVQLDRTLVFKKQ